MKFSESFSAKKAGLAFIIFFSLLLIGFAAIVTPHAKSIHAIRIQTKPGIAEKKDFSIPGLRRAERLPDYKLELKIEKRWQTVGIARNRSAGDGIAFPLAEPIPLFKAQQLRLIEADAVKNDLLEELTMQVGTMEGNAYIFHVAAAFDPGAGILWFFEKTLPGKAIVTAVGLALFLVFILAGVMAMI